MCTLVSLFLNFPEIIGSYNMVPIHFLWNAFFPFYYSRFGSEVSLLGDHPDPILFIRTPTYHCAVINVITLSSPSQELKHIPGQGLYIFRHKKVNGTKPLMSDI